MVNFDINVYIQECHLMVDVVNGTPDMYLVLFNTNAEEISDIVQWNGRFHYTLGSDGIYKFCIVKDPNAVLEDGILKINGYELDARDLADAIAITSNANILGGAERYSEEIFCMCKLKKCLLELQKKVFQDMLKNCGTRSCKVNEYKSQRDFLFIAVWLLEHLAQEGKWEWVKALFEHLQTCGSICDGLLKSNKCGCNG